MYALMLLTWILIGMSIAALQSLLLKPRHRFSLGLLLGGMAALVGGGATYAAGVASWPGGAGSASFVAALVTAIVALLLHDLVAAHTYHDQH